MYTKPAGQVLLWQCGTQPLRRLHVEFLQGVRLVGSLALQSISLTKVKDRFAPLSDHVAIKIGGPVPWICLTAKSPCRSPTDEGVVVTFTP